MTENAISVEVENGMIVSYTQIFNSYSPYPEQISCGSAIDAIDSLENRAGSADEKITDIFTAYRYDEQGTWVPLWFIKDSKGNTSAIASPQQDNVSPSDAEVQ